VSQDRLGDTAGASQTDRLVGYDVGVHFAGEARHPTGSVQSKTETDGLNTNADDLFAKFALSGY
jgi:hypothetical protein